jgi:hypothetical protein
MRPAWRTSIRWAIAASVLAVALPATASAAVVWGQGQSLTLPSGAGAQPSDSLLTNKVVCPSDGNCTIVGAYQDDSNNETETGFTANEVAGTWGPAIKAKAPGGDVGLLNDVSCWSAGNCVAVGGYTDGTGYTQGLIETETNGTWNTGFKAPVGFQAATPDPGETLLHVSCSATGSCVAIGTYQENFGDDEIDSQGLVLTGSGSSFSAKAVSGPADLSIVNPTLTLSGVSCSSAGSCAMTGYYDDDSADNSGNGDQQGLLVNEVAGSPPSTAIKAPVPGDAATDPQEYTFQPSCTGSGDCSFLGIYTNTSDASGMAGAFHTLLFTETSGGLGTPVVASFPDSGTSGQGGAVLSCTAPGVCGAGIQYEASGANERIRLVSVSGGTWGTGVDAAIPSDADLFQDVNAFAGSCFAAGDCAVVGSYVTQSTPYEGLLISEDAGTWEPAVAAILPSGSAATGSNSDLRSVSCSSAAVCTAAGEYSDSDGNWYLLVVSSSNVTPVAPTLTISAPSGSKSGTAIAASAVAAALAGGHSPTGAVTFTVFGPRASAPTTCTSGGTVVGTASAAGDGTYHPSAAFTPSAAGTYWWYAGYAGDLADLPTATACGAGMVKTVVSSSGGGGGAKATLGGVKIKGTTASVSVGCNGSAGQSCDATLTMTVVETLRGSKVIAVAAKAKTKKKTVGVGSAKAVVTAGQHKNVTLALNGSGKALLKKFRTLNATLTLSQGSAKLGSKKLAFKKAKHK